MSILGDIKHGFDKIGDLGKDAHKVIDTGKNLLKKLEGLEKLAKRTVEGGIKKGLHEIESKGKRVVHNAELTVKKGLHEIENKGQELVDDVEDIAKKGIHELEEFKDNALDEIEEKGRELGHELETLPDHMKDAAVTVMRELADVLNSEMIKRVRGLMGLIAKGLKRLKKERPDLAKEIDKVGFDLEFGPMTLHYQDFYSRSEELLTAMAKPPELTRSSIRAFLHGTGPSTVTFNISVQLAFLVAASKDLGLGGGSKNIPFILAVELIDEILEVIGVPD